MSGSAGAGGAAATAGDAEGLPPVDLEVVAAAKDDNDREVTRLIGEGKTAASVDDSGRSALITAAAHGHVRTGRVLLRHGADPNYREPNNKRTALHYAAKDGQTHMVELLHHYKADMTAKDVTGRTALHWACVSDSADVVKRLLSYGLDVDEADASGYSPLITAVEYNRGDIVNVLLKAGADVSKCNNLTHSALEIADWYGSKEVLKTLQEHIASMAGDKAKDTASAVSGTASDASTASTAASTAAGGASAASTDGDKEMKPSA